MPNFKSNTVTYNRLSRTLQGYSEASARIFFTNNCCFYTVYENRSLLFNVPLMYCKNGSNMSRKM